MIVPNIPPEMLRAEYLAEQSDNGKTLSTGVAFIPILTVFYALYMISKIMIGDNRSIEVLLIMPISYIFAISSCVLAILAEPVGGSGRHLVYWLVTDPKIIERNLKINTAAEIVYCMCVTVPKFVFVSLYLKIFVDKWTRRATKVLLLFTILYMSVLIICVFTSCIPLACKYDISRTGCKCGNHLARYRYLGLPNIVSDLMILVIPVPALLKLQISRAKKIGIFVTFAIGILGMIALIVRTILFFKEDIFTDVTFKGIATRIAIVTETSAYFMCAAMPGISPLIRLAYSKSRVGGLFSTLMARKSSQSSSGASNESKGRLNDYKKTQIIRSEEFELSVA